MAKQEKRTRARTEGLSALAVFYQTLMNQFLHQDRLMWDQVQIMIALESLTLGGWYVLRANRWLAIVAEFVGLMMILIVGWIAWLCEQDRDVNQKLMDRLGKKLASGYGSVRLVDERLHPTWWGGGPSLRTIFGFFIVLDAIAILVSAFWPHLISETAHK